MKNIYERKISSEEAREGYFLVLKNRLSFFPMDGTAFSVKNGEKRKKAKIESYHCECQGADKPHEHYFVKWSGLAKGDRLIIKKISTDQQLYSFRVEENYE
jgi:hypothetical protein